MWWTKSPDPTARQLEALYDRVQSLEEENAKFRETDVKEFKARNERQATIIEEQMLKISQLRKDLILREDSTAKDENLRPTVVQAKAMRDGQRQQVMKSKSTDSEPKDLLRKVDTLNTENDQLRLWGNDSRLLARNAVLEFKVLDLERTIKYQNNCIIAHRHFNIAAKKRYEEANTEVKSLCMYRIGLRARLNVAVRENVKYHRLLNERKCTPNSESISTHSSGEQDWHIKLRDVAVGEAAKDSVGKRSNKTGAATMVLTKGEDSPLTADEILQLDVATHMDGRTTNLGPGGDFDTSVPDKKYVSQQPPLGERRGPAKRSQPPRQIEGNRSTDQELGLTARRIAFMKKVEMASLYEDSSSEAESQAPEGDSPKQTSTVPQSAIKLTEKNLKRKADAENFAYQVSVHLSQIKRWRRLRRFAAASHDVDTSVSGAEALDEPATTQVLKHSMSQRQLRSSPRRAVESRRCQD